VASSISFKASGRTREQAIVETLLRSPVPIGIKTPLRPGSTEGILAMHFNLADAVHDNLRNLLLTNFGERLGLYDFGANLRPLTTEFVSQDNFDSAAVERIRSAVSRWMPYVELEDYTTDVERNNNQSAAAVNLTITYNIPSLHVKKRALQITLYVI
jgi:phage baseplate assembly protein W